MNISLPIPIAGIVTVPNAILTTMTEPVDHEDYIPLIEWIKSTMIPFTIAHNGIGLAANQIGIPYSFLCTSREDAPICINPIVLKYSKEKYTDDESCLSIPKKVYKVNRSIAIKLRYIDQHGQLQLRHFGGLTARVIQHEIDHLNGILISESGKYISY